MKKTIAMLKDWRQNLHLLRWVAGHTRPYLAPILLLLLLGGGAAVIGVGQTLANKWIIDMATGGRPILQGVATYIVVVVLSLLVGAVQSIYGAIVNERFAFGIRSRVYSAVLNALWRKVSSFHSGDIVTRLSSDIDIVATGIVEVIPSIFSLLISFLAAFVTLAWFDIRIALFALLLGPVTVIISIVTGRKVKKTQEELQKTESAYRASLQENVENLVVVKAFEGQDTAEKRLAELRRERMYWLRKRQFTNALAGAALAGAFHLGYIAAFSYGASQLSAQLISFGTMTVFLSLVGQIQGPVVSLSRLVPRLVAVLASATRIIELENIPAEDCRVPEASGGPLRLQVENVTFGYGEEEVLRHIDLALGGGEFVALMGSSGIGKTTLIRLIMAYYEPQSGSIRLQDADKNSFAATAGTRHYIAYVPQGNTLMSGTIADNLRMGRPDASEEEMWQVLRVVAADDFVRQAPGGLYTQLGERGHGLSEGQAQRLAIARALLKRAALLILDEATSALDEATELAVLQHLSSMQPRPTCIIVSHRQSVLPFCSRCIRITDAGGIHSEALPANGF